LEIQDHQAQLGTKDSKDKVEYKGRLVEPDLLVEWEILGLLEHPAIRVNLD